MHGHFHSESSERFFRFAAFIAILGTLTTATNIALNELMPDTGGDPMRAAALSRDATYMALQWTLLLHALTTLIPPIALALMRQPGLSGAAVLGAVFTGMEKSTELIGQTLRIFVLNGTWRAQLLTANGPRAEQLLALQEIFSTSWGAMYFVLWVSGSLAALAFALSFRASRIPAQRALVVSAGLVATLGTLMLLSEYFGQSWAEVTHPALYWVAMTAYRAAIAWVLWQHAKSLQRSAGAPLQATM